MRATRDLPPSSSPCLTPNSITSIRGSLLNVLNLLTNPFECGLDLDDKMRNLGVVGLRADRVDFAAHFLGNEFKFAAGAFGEHEGRFVLLQVAAEPDDFFADVAAIGKQGDL